MEDLLKTIGDKLRAWPLAALTLALCAGVLFIAPQQLGILVYKGALLTGAGFGAYWLDRLLFPYSRPHELTSFGGGDHHAEYRRAIIVASALLAVGLSA